MSGPRYLVDGRALTGWSAPRGIGTYVRALLIGLTTLGVGEQLDLLTFRGQPVPSDLARLGLRHTASVPRLKRRIQPVADALLVSAALRRARPSVFHAVEWAQPLIPGRVGVVVTVHDLIPFVFRDDYRWIRRERLLALKQLRFADAVITPSQATAEDVARLARVDAERISVVPHGVDPDFAPASGSSVAAFRAEHSVGDRPYLLFPGTLDERKRRDTLAAVVAGVRGQVDIALVIAGDQAVYRPTVEAALSRAGIREHSHIVGFLRREELVAAYSGATCVVFPSAYEGFGLPVLESLACATAVVAFANSAIPEVAGDAADLVSDGDVPAMTAAVLAVVGESDSAKLARAERARRWAADFTWERSAREHLRVYQRLAGRA